MRNIENFDAIKLVKVDENLNFGITKYSFSRETADKNYIWLNKRNEYHNPIGPAVFRTYETENIPLIGAAADATSDTCCKYFINGRLDRADGPAVIYNSGEEEYWRNGVPHRDDGPAQYGAGGTVPQGRTASETKLVPQGRTASDRTASETKLVPQGRTASDRTERWIQNGCYHRGGGLPALSIFQSLPTLRDTPVLVQTVCYEHDIITNENGPAICIYDYSIIDNEIIIKKREQYWLHGYWISKKVFDVYHAAGRDVQIVIDDYNRRMTLSSTT